MKVYKCPPCKRAYDREWYAARSPISSRVAKDQRLKHKYGISLEDYENLLKDQGSVCAICDSKGTETKSGHRYALAVDHCHITGSVRGLLCQDCNSGIGSLKDDIALLERAIDYLREYEMGLTKYTKTDGPAKVLSPKAHKRAEESLHKHGKTSAQGLTAQEREDFTSSVHSSE